MLDKKAQKIFKMKYATSPEETWEQACFRIASYIASAEESEENKKKFERIFFNLIYNSVFLPGGRIIANSGTNIKNLNNCFVLPIGDSRAEIYETLKNAAEIFAWGGGVGYDFSNIREEGAPIKTTRGQASGPLSFMSLFDQTGEVIQQASRRGAQMGMLRIDHPDVEKFIDFKSKPNSRNTRLLEEYKRNLELNSLDKKGIKYFKVLEKTLQDDQLSHFNISVILTDKFMESVNSGQGWDLISRVTGKSTKNLPAKDLLKQISKMTWESGDPGVYFYDRANEDNITSYLGDLVATNPCITGDTKILTVFDGPRIIKDLAKEGYDVLVYTWNPETKLPEISIMEKPKLTRKNADLVEVEFDSGLKVKCTPDHSFYTIRGEKTKAEDLRGGQSVRAFSVSIHPTDKHLRAHGWGDNKAKHKYVARMVYEYFYGEIPKGYIVHHKDWNEINNRPENLEAITPRKHNLIHGRSKRGRKYNHKVIRITKLTEKEDVYNGTVDGTHTYIISDPEPIAGIYSGIVSANCGEIPLMPYEPCCLGSLNLHSFYDGDRGLNLEFLEFSIRNAIRFLDNVQTLSYTPIEEINSWSKGLRRLGLGVMGFADLLAELEIPYGSEESIKLGNFLSWFISFFSWLESIELAKEKGKFPWYESDRVNLYPLEKVLNSKYSGGKFNIEEIRKIGLRNVSVTSIAPTGTIALLAGVNSGIEPFFALSYKRNITEGVGNIAKDYIIELNPILEKKLKKYGLTEEDIEQVISHVKEYGSLEGLEKIPEKLKRIFSTSHEISWREHVDIQATWQDYVTNAVSKTINCPEDSTVEDIYDIFIYMWNMGLKGGTIYRDKSKSFQILNVGVNNEVPKD